ncbi:BnaC04g02830D [Brassica napus]|uniref:BnaC04g02830D protein n=1 Tax=Brassica napus TaxID=3708 RepID=A0A078FY40_BRANA|nr:BnaC04g02830D [Brassica napus]
MGSAHWALLPKLHNQYSTTSRFNRVTSDAN